MVDPTTVDTPTPTVGGDVYVDCDACDDAEVPLLVGLVIVFKVLPHLKCMHKQKYFQKKSLLKQSKISIKQFLQEHLENYLKSYESYFQNFAQTGSHQACQFIYRCSW